MQSTWRTWNTISSWITFEVCAGEQWRAQSSYMENRRTWNTYSWITSNLKFVLENSGEHRAHGEQENVEYYLVGLHLKTVCAGTVENTEHIKYRRTWNTELSSWITFSEICAGEQ